MHVSCLEGTPSNSSMDRMDKSSDGSVPTHRKETRELPLLHCSTLPKESKQGTDVSSFKVPEIGPVPADGLPKPIKIRNISLDSNDDLSTSEVSFPSTPDNSRSLASTDAWLTAGSVVWAKTLQNGWWPAKVVDETIVQECSPSWSSEHVLVQLFGNNQRQWLDPVRDLSQFDHCYEERSRNPSTEFQDALEEALRKHVNTSSQMRSGNCSGGLKSSTSEEHSPDGWKTPSSNGTNDGCIEAGRGRRKRKLKLHFDELTCQEKPARRLRRLRIMRNLALAAPAGSPFSVSHGKSAS